MLWLGSQWAATETASRTKSMLLALVLEAMLHSEEKCYSAEVKSISP